MASPRNDFAMYCCELLSGVGPCTAKRMFGGWGISTSGLTLALVADLGGGDKLWLKADADTRGQYEAQGCERFTYEITRGGVTAPHSLNYYTAPEEAMESPAVMLPWARVALECALKARAAKPPKPPKPPEAPKAPTVKKTPKAPAGKTAKAARTTKPRPKRP
ncbi:MAG: TfoX/Sxy family protein [Polaromonas sp.]|nr:TfoX/Sxy family protein [Polaromonas sp.]